MKLAVPRESEAGEPRVAATPDTVKKFVSLGFEVHVEKDAGLQSRILDADYEAAARRSPPTRRRRLAAPTWCSRSAGPAPTRWA